MKSIAIVAAIAFAVIGCGESKERVASLEFQNDQLTREIRKLREVITNTGIELNRAESYADTAISSFSVGDFNGGVSYLNALQERIYRAKRELNP
jgi:hypothetical protein